ncbi:MAG: Helix-turn-helix domain protein [Firmicutes bacterium ADurb.Bin419]|nr:MAG: Helix-turn-helix domain protein [Firmicutes bacterium ADurb.Bin419]
MGMDNINKNIRNLRIAYGETQMDLAYAIGLDSTGAISNYENGSRTPNSDVRKKIAVHYRITEDELMYGDFSRANVVSFPFDDTDKMKELATTVLPIICTDEALRDPLFRKGYEYHTRIYRNMKESEDFEEKDIDICLDAYNESHESNYTLESAANCLWWYLLFGIVMTNGRVFDGVELLEKKQIKKAEFIKNYILYNSDSDYYNEDEAQLKRERQKFIEDGEKDIVSLLRKLKASPKWSDLADYYTALRYSFYLVNNNLSDNMNQTVGGEMMWAIATLGNKYAKAFLRVGIDNNKK